MKLRRRLNARLEGLRQRPLASLNPGQRALRYVVDLVIHCGGELRRDRATQMAAALTYHTLFSLLPTLALVLVALHAFVGPQEREDFKNHVVEWVIEPLRTEQPPSPATEVGPRAPLARVEEARAALESRLEKALEALERVDFGGVGLIGLLLFLWAATGLLATIEGSFDTIFGSTRKRPWHRRLTLYYTVLTVGPIVLLAGIWLRQQLIDLLAAGALTAWLARPLSWLSPLLTTWLVVLLTYWALPNVRVKVRSAALGAFLAAALLALISHGFSSYVSRAAVATLYGALALLPLFLLYLFVTWLVVLFGLEITYTLQVVRGGDFQAEARKSRAAALVDPEWVIPVAVHIALDFRDGRLTRLDQLEEALDLPYRSLVKLVEALERAGLIHEVSEDEGTGFTLARPSSDIGLSELIDTARDMVPERRAGGNDSPSWRTLRVLRDAERRAVAGRSLEDVCSDEPGPVNRADPADSAERTGSGASSVEGTQPAHSPDERGLSR